MLRNSCGSELTWPHPMHGPCTSSPGIAVVGMACVYPDARTPVELWENVLAQRRAFRRIPPERLRLEDYWSADAAAEDRTYSTEAAVIEGYDFDRLLYRAVGSTFRSADMSHWLALDVAARTLADAGFAEGRGLPRDATGVLLGNTLTGEFSRANTLRLRWPYVRRVLDAALEREGWSPATRLDFLERLETDYKAPFPPVGEETLAGGLSNTIAGRICNQFDFHGGGYTLDGACASSLLAVANACSSLTAGDLDVALAGGVDLSLDPFELVGFAKTSALAADEMRVFDQRSAGFWPGEGCGFVLLMRQEDALAHGCRIYALIRGWGISSDGSGGITRPDANGQLEALRRAYRRAGFTSDTVTYCEGHGTGTAVGDATELEVLSRARREANPGAPAAVLGSIKANIGHTKAAAGIAGFIKATMAVHSQVLPPTTGCSQPHPHLCEPGASLRILREPELWPADRPLRAAVSAMGFGGINAHVVLEGGSAQRRRTLASRELSLARSHQEAELFLFSASTPEELAKQSAKVLLQAGGLSRAELTDLAAALERNLGDSPVLAAIVASRPAELASRLRTLQEWLAAGASSFRSADGIYLGAPNRLPRFAFLFPGQGSPVHTNGGIWARRFESVRELYARANLASDADPVSTRSAQPAVITASLAGLRVLEQFGVRAEAAVGHSLGEMAALHWSGAISDEALLRVARVRGAAMADLKNPSGAMAAIAARHEDVASLIDSERVAIVGFNSPRQTVVAGEHGAIHELIRRAGAAGWHASVLPVSHAFHTALVAGAVPALAAQLACEQFSPLERPVFSTITGKQLASSEPLSSLLCRQVTSPVRFSEALSALLGQKEPAFDLLIEVGPGSILTGLVHESTSVPILALDAGGPSLVGLLNTLGAAFALGARVLHRQLFADRFTRPFDLERKLSFFENPCESAPIPAVAASPTERERLYSSSDQNGSPSPVVSASRSLGPPAPSPSTLGAPASLPASLDPLPLVRQLVAQRAELPLTSIRDFDRMLTDLHLNSITVGQLVSEAARSLGLPPLTGLTEFANGSVAEIATALEELRKTGAGARPHEHQPAGVDTWFRMFTMDWVEIARPAPRRATNGVSGEARGWQIFCASNEASATNLKEKLHELGGSGVVLWLQDPDGSQVGLMLAAARAVLALKSHPRFLVIQHGWGASGFARSLHLETPGLTTCVVNAPASHPQFADWVVAEAASVTGFIEVRYDEQGRRSEPRLRLIDTPSSLQPGSSNAAVPLTPALSPGEREHVSTAQEPAVTCDAICAANGAPSPRGEGRGEGDRDLRKSDSTETNSTLGTADVVLVTGGGKGIAAECALALGRETGASIALLGRSALEEDQVLMENLARFAAARVKCCYVRADVADAAAVNAAVAEAQRQFGPITALIHGAGTNHPQLLGAMDEPAFRRTLSPKLDGARNLLAALDRHRLKLLVGFGSIIARTGLAGEADYATANEWLRARLDDFQNAHPRCRCITLEWSVWSGVGMGQRLGRIESLLELGIVPLPVEEGVRLFLQALRPPGEGTGTTGCTAVVISGRFGEPPTLKLAQTDLPLRRFLERKRVHYPGIELVVDSELSAATDLYTAEHTLQNQSLLPAVLGMEAMAQVAMALTGAKAPPVFEQVELTRPVVIHGSRATTIRVAALRRAPDLVEVCLRAEETGFQADHFRALCRFALSSSSSSSSSSSPCRAVAPSEGGDSTSVALDPARDLYGPLLFHRGRFRRIAGYTLLKARECIAQIAPADPSAWFSSYLPAELVLGDPAARDAALHAIQACIPHRRVLPVSIKKLWVFQVAASSTARTVHALERQRTGNEFIYDLEVRNPEGELLESWEGLRLRAIESLSTPAAWPSSLLGPYIERRIEELLDGSSINLVVRPTGSAGIPAGQSGVPAGNHAASNAALHDALGRRDPIFRRPDGKPVLHSKNGNGSNGSTTHEVHTPLPSNENESVSASHSQGVTLALAAGSEAACDVEAIASRCEADWQALLGEDGWRLATQIAADRSEALDSAATRLWAARETMKKLGRPASAPLILTVAASRQSAADQGADAGWLLLRSGNLVVATYIAAIRDLVHPVAIAVALEHESASHAAAV